MTASGCASEDSLTAPTARAGAPPLPARNKPVAAHQGTLGKPVPPSLAAVAVATPLPEEPIHPTVVVAVAAEPATVQPAEPRPRRLPLPASIHNSCKTCSPACCRRRSVGKT